MESTQEQSDEQQKLSACLDSPELKKLRSSFAAFQKKQWAEDQAWWDSLSYEDKAQAFRQICKLIHQAEVIDGGSYRWAIYDVFGLEYGDGLDHYMELHNLISRGMDREPRLVGTMDEKGDKETRDDGTNGQ